MLSPSQARCLLAVYSLNEVYGRASSKDVCKLLGLSKPSVHNALAALENKDLIAKKPYGAAILTEQGESLANELEARRAHLTLFFSKTFGLSMDQSDLAALLLLTGLNEESLQKMGCMSSAAPAPEDQDNE